MKSEKKMRFERQKKFLTEKKTLSIPASVCAPCSFVLLKGAALEQKVTEHLLRISRLARRPKPDLPQSVQRSNGVKMTTSRPNVARFPPLGIWGSPQRSQNPRTLILRCVLWR
jgi:hypothetical protein